MFGKMLRMDCRRCFGGWKFIIVVLTSALLLIASGWDVLDNALLVASTEERQIHYGAIDLLQYVMDFDVFKIVIVFLISGLYTGSFCQDKSSNYLRQILSRTDMFLYVRSRFLSNVIVIITAAIMTCFLFIVLIMLMGFPLMSRDAQGGLIRSVYYIEILHNYPYVYTGMMGLQFGMLIAAFSSIGLLFSVYQPNSFICIGVSGFLFFIMLSVDFLNGTPFDILAMIALDSPLRIRPDKPSGGVFAWGMLLPMMVITLTCILFERRMKWRCENGYI